MRYAKWTRPARRTDLTRNQELGLRGVMVSLPILYLLALIISLAFLPIIEQDGFEEFIEPNATRFLMTALIGSLIVLLVVAWAAWRLKGGRRDLVLLAADAEGVGGLGVPVRLRFFHRGMMYGEDRGYLGVENGLLTFWGSVCSFAVPHTEA